MKPTRAQLSGTLELTLTWGDNSTTVQEVQFGDGAKPARAGGIETPEWITKAMAKRTARELRNLLLEVDVSPGTREALNLGEWARPESKRRRTVTAATTTVKPTTATWHDFATAELLVSWKGHRHAVAATAGAVDRNVRDPAVIRWVLEGEQARRQDRSELLIDTCKRRLSELAAGAGGAS